MGCTASSSSTSRYPRNTITVSPQNDDQPPKTDKSLCRKHGGKPLTKYSETNDKLYCKLCILNNRTLATQVMEIREYVQTIQFKQKRIKTEDDIRSEKRNINSLLSDVKDNITALDAQKNNLIEEINNFKAAVIDIINCLCDELCERVASICGKEKRSLYKRKDEIFKCLESMNYKESDNAAVKNPDAIRILTIIDTEKILSSLRSAVHDDTFVDMQLKLHDNIPLRKLLQCDKTASTLGEVIVLRNVKAKRPCTKDLIVHDISDIDETAENEETFSDDSGEDIEDNHANTALARKQALSLFRTLNMQPSHNVKSAAEIRNKPDERNKKNRMTRNSQSVADDSVDRKGPIFSQTPRMEQRSRNDSSLNTQDSFKADRESISRISQSIQSNFSIMTPSSIQFGTPLSEKKFFERKAVLVKTVTLPEDIKVSDVSSSVVLQNGNVILCDRRNKKLRYFDHSFRHISDLKFDHEPNSICLINDETTFYDKFDAKVAVTFPKQRSIQVVNVNSDTLAKVDEIRTEPECWGIGCKGKSLVFSTENGDVFRDVGDYRNYRWRKYRYTFQKPVFLSVENNSIYVCNWGLDEVYGSLAAMHFDDRGKDQIQFSYSNRFLRPISCSLDCEGNIYICDAESKSIHQVTSDGSQYRILDVKGGETGSWQHINFVPQSDLFLLTERDSNVVYVYQMK